MADRPKRSWGTFKNAMKAKRCKPNGNENKLGKGSIVERKEMVVQRLSAEVSGKAQKYSRVGPREFVPYEEEELTIPAIKAACEKHFALAGMVCDVLAGEQGPSCQSTKHIPDPKVIHVRFIEPADACDDPGFSGASLQMPSKSFQHPFSVPMLPSRQKEQDINKVKVKIFPKSLSLSEMLKLGKVVDTDASTSVLEVYSFDLDKMAWSLIPQKVEFAIGTEVLGSLPTPSPHK